MRKSSGGSRAQAWGAGLGGGGARRTKASYVKTSGDLHTGDAASGSLQIDPLVDFCSGEMSTALGLSFCICKARLLDPTELLWST